MSFVSKCVWCGGRGSASNRESIDRILANCHIKCNSNTWICHITCRSIRFAQNNHCSRQCSLFPTHHRQFFSRMFALFTWGFRMPFWRPSGLKSRPIRRIGHKFTTFINISSFVICLKTREPLNVNKFISSNGEMCFGWWGASCFARSE